MNPNPFAQYRTLGYHKPYRGIPISRLEEFKMFRHYAESVTESKLPWRYIFRGPRLRDMYGQSASMTLKSNAHSFDVYCR
jgi:hypothetical protein